MPAFQIVSKLLISELNISQLQNIWGAARKEEHG